MTNRCTIIAIRIIVNSTLISTTSTKVILCLPLCVRRSSPLTKNCVAMILFVKSSEVELRMQTRVSIELSGPCAPRRGTTLRSVSSMQLILAVIIYNDGFIGLMPIYKSFGITLDIAILGMLKKIDRERINEDKSFDPVLRLEQRRRNRFERLRTDAQLTREDPHKYGAGIAD